MNQPIIKSQVKRLEISQITKGRNRFILYIGEDSKKSLRGCESHRKYKYNKREFLEIHQISRNFTNYQEDKLLIFYLLHNQKKYYMALQSH